MSTHNDTGSSGMQRLLDRFPPALQAVGGLLLVLQVLFGFVLVVPIVFGFLFGLLDGGGGSKPRPRSVVESPRREGPVMMTLVVTGDRRTAEVDFNTSDGSVEQSDKNVRLPLRRTVRVPEGGHLLVSAQKSRYAGAGKITCTVLIGDRVVEQSSNFGDSASVNCLARFDSKPIAGATVPPQGNGILPGEVRLTKKVPVRRYKGKGSPVVGRVSDGDPRLSYLALGGEWGRSREVDPQISGYHRRQGFESEVGWEAVIASGFVKEELVLEARGRNRLRTLAWAVQDYRQSIAFDEARGRDVASQPITVGGRRGWVIVREVRFKPKKNMRATMDLSVVAVVDTGRPRPSFLWIDIPDTHKHLWPDVNTVLDSLSVD
ncbi:hypothetical protein GCM10009678_20700 [Actinomadura kijaniata]|uniref:Uncharacterized protein n=1 Tax=Actinomadura namibiensis TaxID=182080 RepID=A0A7W3LJ85_ACTNM|nr:hypothetical protein [Actinomadura namibiensis]MBA8949052.1 hypothetical protein [Actinomadura namibiensis]